MSSTTQNVSASHNSGTAPTATPSNTSGDNSATASASGGDTTYPEQIHAGKVGYGPNYRTGPVCRPYQFTYLLDTNAS